MVAHALVILGVGSLAVVASACGAIPFALRASYPPTWIGLGSAVAAGVMLSVSGGLALEGGERSIGALAAGAAVGMVFVQVIRSALRRSGELNVTDLAGADRRRAVLIVAALTVHSAAESIGLASSFAGSKTFGWTVAVALAPHKLPEGFAISLVLTPRGVRLPVAAALSALAASPLPLLAVPAFLVVASFRTVLPAALGFAAGAMILVVVTEMLPEAARRAPARLVFVHGSIAFGATILFQAAVALM